MPSSAPKRPKPGISSSTPILDGAPLPGPGLEELPPAPLQQGWVVSSWVTRPQGDSRWDPWVSAATSRQTEETQHQPGRRAAVGAQQRGGPGTAGGEARRGRGASAPSRSHSPRHRSLCSPVDKGPRGRERGCAPGEWQRPLGPPPQVGAQKPSPKPPVETTQRTVWLGPQHPHQVLPPSRRSSSSFQGFRHSSQSSFLQGALRYRQTEPPRAETPNSALRDIRKCPGVLRSENGPLVPPVQCTDGKKKVTRRVRKAGGRCLASICPQLFNR